MAVIVALIAAFGFLVAAVVWKYRRGDDMPYAMPAFYVCVALGLAIGAARGELRWNQHGSGECWVDWDGRTNPTICN